MYRIQNELRLYAQKPYALRTTHKALSGAKVKPLLKSKRTSAPQRSSRPISEDRVQMDTMQVALKRYQSTTLDACSSFRLLTVYSNWNVDSTLLFLEHIVEEIPFPTQRIQTDSGTECFAQAVQHYLMGCAIKFRPIPPRSPHFNGKVERFDVCKSQNLFAQSVALT